MRYLLNRRNKGQGRRNIDQASRYSDRKTSRGVKLSACLLAGITIVSLIFPLSLPLKAEAAETDAAAWPNPGDVQSQAASVIDVDSGTFLYEKNVDDRKYPASITKLMTALVAAENSSMDDTVTFSSSAVFDIDRGSSSIARDVDEQMTMEQTMYGMLLESANECANAIAEHVGGGDRNKFVDMMNAKAKELGCTNTHFANPSGLPNDDHYTTAHDMALIAAAAYKNPIVAKIVGTKQYTIPPTNKHADPTNLFNHHQMLCNHKGSKWLYDGCLGGKTGYTTVAGNTLVTYAKRNDMLLAVVVLGAGNQCHYIDTTNLLNFYFSNYKEYKVSDIVNTSQVKSSGILGKNVNLVEIGDGSFVLPATADPKDVKTTIKKASSDSSDKKAGTVICTYGGKEVGSANLTYTNKKSDSYPFHNVSAKEGGSKEKSIRLDFRMILLAVLIVIAALVLISLGIARMKKWRTRHPKRAKVYQQDMSKYKKINDNSRSGSGKKSK